MSIEMVASGIVGGLVSGAVASALGYAKSSTNESFSEKKLVRTMISGAFVGAFAGYYGMSYDNALAFVTTSGGLLLFEFTMQGIWRRVGDKIMNGLRKFDEWLKS